MPFWKANCSHDPKELFITLVARGGCDKNCVSQAPVDVLLPRSDVALAAVGEVLGTLSVAVSRM